MKERFYDLVVYFQDSPTPVYIENVKHINTEGGLLRMILNDDKSQWWPLCNIATIRELDKRIVEKQE